MTHRRTLRVELAAALALVVMMAVVSLSFTGEMFAQNRLKNLETQRLREHARGLSLLVAATQANGGGTSRLEAVLQPSVGTLNVTAIELFSNRHERIDPILSLGLPLDIAPPDMSTFDNEDNLHEREGWLVVDRPIRHFGATAGSEAPILRVTIRRSAWAHATNWRELATSAIGVGFVSFVLGVALLELQVLRPLARLQLGVRRVAAGDLAASLLPSGPRELQNLATAFNEMTQRLSQRVREIQAQREQLTRAEQLASLGRIAAGTAHEVGNPLAAVLGYIELLLDPHPDTQATPQQRDILERSRSQLLRIQNIIAQLLDYSRPSELHLEVGPISPALRRIAHQAADDPRCVDVEIAVEAPNELRARFDEHFLGQVVHNLLVNGARAAAQEPGPPQIRIRAWAENNWVHIDVQDSGPGIPSEIRSQLFEPFFTTSPAGQGTGLGLAISRGLAERMGGKLACLDASTYPPLWPQASPGAVFRVTLPGSRSLRDARAPGDENGLGDSHVLD